MDNRTNTIAGWVLAGCVAALGLSIASGLVFHEAELEKKGYPIEGVAADGEAGGAAAEAPIATMMASADVTRGAEVFKKCSACHAIAQGGANGIGPNLWATMGAPIAGHAGFAYSEALKAKGGNWDFEAMNAWLKSPRRFADGTKMTFAGLSNPQDRADVIAYMNAQGSNLPLPAAPVQAASADGEATNASAPANDSAPANETAPATNTSAPAPK